MAGDDAEIARLIAGHGLPATYRATVERAAIPLTERIVQERRRRARPVVMGLCGSQGSGKSTLAAFVARLLAGRDLAAAVVSIDDLYLTREARLELAATTHPLFATRGAPGTHDVALGLDRLEALTTGPRREVSLPRFDKASDTRAPERDWSRLTAPVDAVILEGWLVGARPEPPTALAEPANALERREDADGRWRATANAALAGPYQRLFARLDLLVLLQAPSFEQVYAWRALQEARLAERLAREGRPATVMDEAALRRFIAHYERLTRWILGEMPERADVVIRLNAAQEVVGVRGL